MRIINTLLLILLLSVCFCLYFGIKYLVPIDMDFLIGAARITGAVK